jgi:dynein intermediate chain 1
MNPHRPQAVAAGEGEFVVDTGGGKNSFDYSDRAAQTFNNPMRERGVATEPPPCLSFSATCTQWEIYDSYIDHYRRELADQDTSKVCVCCVFAMYGFFLSYTNA